MNEPEISFYVSMNSRLQIAEPSLQHENIK